MHKRKSGFVWRYRPTKDKHCIDIDDCAWLSGLVPLRVQAQTFKVIYDFQGSTIGGQPHAGLTMDRAGNLYGTAFQGGTGGAGGVFKLAHSQSEWIFMPLYAFSGGSGGADGGFPTARVIFGPDGALYGTTEAGGGNGCYGEGCGTVFSLRPPPTACKTALCPWTETALHTFGGVGDGSRPYSEVVFDASGKVYGTTSLGGTGNGGTVYELTRSNGGWLETTFGNLTGSDPWAGVVFDNAGNLYGTTLGGGIYGYGTVFELTPSGSGWIQSVLYSFQGQNDGGFPIGGLTLDASGNIYGTTSSGGIGNGGTVFELTPFEGGNWAYNAIYRFPGQNGQNGGGPQASLAFDASGNLYGTTYSDGAYGYGSVFKLTPPGDGWTYTSLHDFTGFEGAAYPISNVIFDANGNLFGTTSANAVWEIAP